MNLLINLYLGALLVGSISIVGMLLVGALSHGAGHSGGDGQAHGHGDAHVGAVHGLWSFIAPFLNVASVVALLMCAGGSGYLALKIGSGRLLSLFIATAAGVGGAWLMVTTMRLLARAEAGRVVVSDPRGTLARVISPIAKDRMGEIVFTREDGVRQALPARLDEPGEQIERNAEVVVTRVERGTAYVQRLAEKENATWN